MFLDYRDLKEKYDKVASIEMIEAVGEKYLDKYFNTIKKSLISILGGGDTLSAINKSKNKLTYMITLSLHFVKIPLAR